LAGKREDTKKEMDKEKEVGTIHPPGKLAAAGSSEIKGETQREGGRERERPYKLKRRTEGRKYRKDLGTHTYGRAEPFEGGIGSAVVRID
jgi:hypothetical protein